MADIFAAIKKLIKRCVVFFYQTMTRGQPLCYISEVNLTKKIITINFRGFNTSVKLSFDEMINDHMIISNLSSVQASWIGFYYGRYYNELKNNNVKSHLLDCNFSINSEDKINKYSVVMLNRQSHIIYLDHSKGITDTIIPMQALMWPSVIGKFLPNQACYIGILAGVREKNVNTSLCHVRKAQLTLVT